MASPTTAEHAAAPATPRATLPSLVVVWATPVLSVHLPLMLAILGFLAIALPADDTRADVRTVAALMLAVFAVIAVPNVAGFTLLTGGYRRCLTALRRGVDPRRLDPADVRGALGLPVRMLALGLFLWAIGGPIYVAAVWLEGSQPLIFVWEELGTSLALGVVGGTLAFYRMSAFVATRVTPVLLPDGDLDRLGGFTPVRVYHHVALLVIVLALVQPMLGALLARLGATSTWTPIYVGALFLVFATFQTLGIVRAVTLPLGTLIARMRAVYDGDLDVRAPIENLDTIGVMGARFNQMVDGLKQRDFIKETFGRYVAREVVDVILAGAVALGGERRVATVLFSDIRGFTRLSESMAPEEVVVFLNEYFDAMVDCVIRERGMLDKFIGDAVMAVFGVPVAQAPGDDAVRAARAALAMSDALDALNAARLARGQAPVEIGIGLHSGPLVAGNIGSSKRMEYTVIGDTVNLASRLEGMTKELKRRVLVSESTAALLGDAFTLERVGRVAVRGRTADVEVFAVGRGRAEA